MLPIKHSINLYLPRFRPPELSAEVLLLIKTCFITVAGLICVSIILLVFQAYSSGQVTELKQDQKQLNLELSSLIAQFPNNSLDKNLQVSIEREEKLITKKTRAITFLRQDSISARSSFTPLVEQLSEQDISGIWLSRVEVLNQGKDIQLFGFAKTPDKVSRYIATLGSKNAYRGRTFKHINIMQGDSPWNEFFLSTKKKNLDDLSVSQERALGREL